MLDPLGTKISEDNLSILGGIKLSAEELERAAMYTGSDAEVAQLDKCEAFVVYVARMTRWDAKLKATMTIRNYRAMAERIHEMVDAVTKACRQVRYSEKFRIVLGGLFYTQAHANHPLCFSPLPRVT